MVLHVNPTFAKGFVFGRFARALHTLHMQFVQINRGQYKSHVRIYKASPLRQFLLSPIKSQMRHALKITLLKTQVYQSESVPERNAQGADTGVFRVVFEHLWSSPKPYRFNFLN